MAKKTPTLQPRLLKIAIEARMKPELQRFRLLHSGVAGLQGYPDWTAGFTHVRLIDKTTHSSLLVSNAEVRYLQDSGEEHVEKERAAALTPELFGRLDVSHLLRMGHRRWYLLPLEMTFQEAVALFSLQYYPEEDPVRSLGHEINDVLYRVDSRDADGWRWHVTLAPVPRAQAVQLVEYDLEAHWQRHDGTRVASRVFEGFPEVALYLDLDCYREGGTMPVEEWSDFLARSRSKIEHVSRSLFTSSLGRKVE